MKAITKKIFVFILPLALSPLLVSCGKQDDTSSRPSPARPDPNGGGNSGTAPGQPSSPQMFFEALSRSEQMLVNAYGNPYDNLRREDFRALANRSGLTVNAVKSQYLEEVFAFALNLTTLKNREQELTSHNLNLYQNYENKFNTLGKKFIKRRARHYTDRMDRLSSVLENAGFRLKTIFDVGGVKIELPLAEPTNINRRLRAQLLDAKTVCTGLKNLETQQTPFNQHLSGKDIATCTPSDFVYHIKSNNPSIDQLARDVNFQTAEKAELLNDVSNSFLAASGITYTHRRSRAGGIDQKTRRQWERQIIKDNRGNSPEEVENALQNNLYENLIFKKGVGEILLKTSSNFSNRERRKLRNFLTAIKNSLIGINHTPKTSLTLGKSPISHPGEVGLD